MSLVSSGILGVEQSDVVGGGWTGAEDLVEVVDGLAG